MFIETVPNRDSLPALPLRKSYRDPRRHSQQRTLARLSKPPFGVCASEREAPAKTCQFEGRRDFLTFL